MLFDIGMHDGPIAFLPHISLWNIASPWSKIRMRVLPSFFISVHIWEWNTFKSCWNWGHTIFHISDLRTAGIQRYEDVLYRSHLHLPDACTIWQYFNDGTQIMFTCKGNRYLKCPLRYLRKRLFNPLISSFRMCLIHVSFFFECFSALRIPL